MVTNEELLHQTISELIELRNVIQLLIDDLDEKVSAENITEDQAQAMREVLEVLKSFDVTGSFNFILD